MTAPIEIDGGATIKSIAERIIADIGLSQFVTDALH
jgi:hypothetical protein